MTSLADFAVTNRSVTRELSIDRTPLRRRQYAQISPVSRVRHWVIGLLSEHFFRVPKSLR
jgi:hypothetical protein